MTSSPAKKRKDNDAKSVAAAPTISHLDKVDYQTLVSLTKIPCCFGRSFDTKENDPHTNCALASNLDRFKEQKTIYQFSCRGAILYLCELDLRRTRGICVGCGRCITTRADDAYVTLKASAAAKKKLLVCAACQSNTGPDGKTPLHDSDTAEVQAAWMAHQKFARPSDPRGPLLGQLAKTLSTIVAKSSSSKQELLDAFKEIAFRKTANSLRAFLSRVDANTTKPDELPSLALVFARSPALLHAELEVTTLDAL